MYPTYSKANDATIEEVKLYDGLRNPDYVIRGTAGALLYYKLGEPTGVLSYAWNIAVALGRDLVIEGAFPNDPGVWTLGANWSIAGGKATYDDLGNTSIREDIPIQGGATYTLSFTIADLASGTASIAFANNTGSAIYVAQDTYANGNHTVNFTAPSTQTNFAIFGNNASTGSWSITNVVVKQTNIEPSYLFPKSELYVTPNAASDPAGNEADATTGWADGASGTVSSDSSVKAVGDYSIKGVFAGSSAWISFDLDTILTVGKRYRLKYDTRHLGSGGVAQEHLASAVAGTDNLLVALVNTDTTFQPIDVVFTHSATTRYLSARERSATDDGGVYIDNISITEQNPLDAPDTGTTPGQPMGSLLGKLYDGATATTNKLSAEYNSVFDPTGDFTRAIAIQKSTWDTTKRFLFYDYVDANNYTVIYTSTVQDQIVFEHKAGGTAETITYDSTGVTGVLLLDCGADSGVFKARINGVNVGSEAIAGTYVGNLTIANIGSGDGANYHLGLASYDQLFSVYVPDSDMLRIARSLEVS